MKINRATDIIRREIIRTNLRYEERPSVSTNSVYFKIYTTTESLLFRVGDHATRSNVITLRIDHKTNEKSVSNFTRNRIDDLRKRSLKGLLGM